VLSKFAYEWIEKGLIDRMVNSLGIITQSASGGMRYLQSGYLGFYMISMVVIIIVIVLFKLVI
jgi:NADH-quinone oxidoreductase subunit L